MKCIPGKLIKQRKTGQAATELASLYLSIGHNPSSSSSANPNLCVGDESCNHQTPISVWKVGTPERILADSGADVLHGTARPALKSSVSSLYLCQVIC